MNQRLLTVEEAAKEIRISACGVRRLIKKRQIPFRQVGKRQFFTLSDIEDYLEKCSVPAIKVNAGGAS